MKRKIIFVVLYCIVAIPMLLPATNANAAPYRHERTNIVFPDTVNTLKLVKTTDYEPLYAGLGTGISYRTETMRADIFLYDLKQGPIPEGASHITVTNEFEQALNDILALEKQGTYKNVSILIRKEIIPVGPKLKFVHSLLTYQQNNIKLISHLYLTGHNGLFVKLRITYFQDARVAEEANLMQFLSMIDDITRTPPK
ncbi:MAG: hypothetical protein ABFD12_14105 [Syntrophorhabdus sp.]